MHEYLGSSSAPAPASDLLQVVAHRSASYAARTRHNARTADLTVAFALDYSTRGEALTRSAAGDRYLALRLDADRLAAARQLYQAVRHFDAQCLNVAGNGLHTLVRHHWDQARTDEAVFGVLQTVAAHWPIARIVCGGQTGADLAGATAGIALGIPVVMTLPAGLLQRDADGIDRTHTPGEIRDQVDRGTAALRQAPPSTR